jgi:hypothetical protein
MADENSSFDDDDELSDAAHALDGGGEYEDDSDYMDSENAVTMECTELMTNCFNKRASGNSVCAWQGLNSNTRTPVNKDAAFSGVFQRLTIQLKKERLVS